MTKDTYTVYTHQVTNETQKDYQNKRTSTETQTTADCYMCLSSVPETEPRGRLVSSYPCSMERILCCCLRVVFQLRLPRGSSAGLYPVWTNRTALAVSEKQQISKTCYTALIICSHCSCEANDTGASEQRQQFLPWSCATDGILCNTLYVQ